MENGFRYARIGEALIREIQTRLHTGQLTLILGPRYVGKRCIEDLLCERLAAESSLLSVKLQFLNDTPMLSREQFSNHLHNALGTSPTAVTGLSDDDRLLAPLEQFADQQAKPIVLFAANVDSMAHDLTHQFLSEVKSLVEAGNLAAVLSGENSFQELVYGPMAVFDPDALYVTRYVLQGLDHEAYREFMAHYVRTLHIAFDDFDGISDYLYHYTGGQTFLSRLLVWSVMSIEGYEGHGRPIEQMQRVISLRDIPDYVRLPHVPASYGEDAIRHGIELVLREPDCWERLRQLQEDETVPLASKEVAPTVLEIAGFAIRTPDSKLQLASPLMRKLLRDHYTDARFGDMYARVNQWDQAFECYRNLSPDERIRPAGFNDLPEFERIVDTLSATLLATAEQGIEPVKQLFVTACHLLLGFSTVTFWLQRGNTTWELEETYGTELEPEYEARMLARLKGTERAERVDPVRERARHYDAGILLKVPLLFQSRAVMVSNSADRRILSRIRWQMTVKLVSNYARAWRYAVDMESHTRSMAYYKIVSSIIEELGAGVRDVRTSLQIAARELLSLNYRRVLISWVDPTEERIRGVVDARSDNSSEDIAEMIDVPLDAPTHNIQSYVLVNKVARTVRDASAENDVTLDTEVLKRAGMKAFAVVPVLSGDSEDTKAVGTILIERKDQTAPFDEEVRDIERFGRHLAAAIGQAERVSMLLQAILCIAKADSTEAAMRQMQDAVKLMGFDETRLYFLDRYDKEVLHLERPFGSRLKGYEDGEGRWELRVTKSEFREGWESLENKQPMLNCYFEQRPFRDLVPLKYGLTAINLAHIRWPEALNRHDRDIWIDFPLGAGDNTLGKLIIDCSEALRKDQYAALRVLCGIVNGLLTSFQEKEEWTRKMARKWASDATYLLLTPTVNLYPEIRDFRAQYPEYEAQCPALGAFYDRITAMLAEFDEVAEQVQDTLITRSPQFTRFDLVEMFRAYLETVRVLPEKEEIRLHANNTEINVEANAFLLKRLLRELIQNSRAAFHLPEKRYIDMDISVIDQNGIPWIRFTYQDNGPGIPPGLKQRIFEPFFTTRNSTGLGLDIVRRICESHNGNIVEEGDPNGGARFVIQFPEFRTRR